MKILIVFTGGTIGSAVQGDYISTDKKTPYKLLSEYEKNYGIDFEYDAVQPYSELSENNTGETVLALSSCLKKELEKNYDGVIVTHGTDTLQYTAAALSYTFGKCGVPVCLVSANYIIGDGRSNGLINFRGAVNFIRRKIGGVWVIYKNSDEENVTVHGGARLLESQAFSDCFYSAGNSFFGRLDSGENFIKNENYREFSDEISPIFPSKLNENSDFILRVNPYVGMTFPQIDTRVKYVVMGTFHSGTFNTKSEYIKDFFSKLREKNITVFLTGTAAGTSYESTKAFKELNVVPVPNIAPIALYMKIWLAEAAGLNVHEIITKKLGGDFF
ncbi:MAG: asparaginase domain-containing protein [Oscillospiraceae bacterium]|nr:asparaginase domain-containing protein [Oscillospiraceae bacterium]